MGLLDMESISFAKSLKTAQMLLRTACHYVLYFNNDNVQHIVSFSCYVSSFTSPTQWHPSWLHRYNYRELQHSLSIFLQCRVQRSRLFVKKMSYKRKLEWPRFPLPW